MAAFRQLSTHIVPEARLNTQNRHEYKNGRKKTRWNNLTKLNYYTDKHIIHMSTFVAARVFVCITIIRPI